MTHAIIKIVDGYKDDYKMNLTETGVENIDMYVVEGSGPYVYDEENATMIVYNAGLHAGWTRYNIQQVQQHVQKSSEIFESSLETVDMLFTGENIETNIIKMFFKANISIASLAVARAVDSNYVFSTATAEKILGTNGETGSWENTSVRYCGSKQTIIKTIPHETRISDSIKFKFIPQLQIGKLDDIKIHGVEVLHNGSIFVGDDNA